MKKQLLSTLTQKKAWALFFLTLLHLKRGEAGQAFKNCLLNRLNDTTSYDILTKQSFPSDSELKFGFTINICCSKSDCHYENFCSLNELPYYFACARTNQTNQDIVCGTWGTEVHCTGVIGGEPIKNNFIRKDCPPPTSISDSIYNISKSALSGLEQGYANCVSEKVGWCNQWNSCNWDNGGWSCFKVGCFIQWPAPWPGPADKNPFIQSPVATQTAISTHTATTIPPSPTTLPEDNHLVEKILIPIGIVIGISLLSGLTYYLWKKRKKQSEDLQSNQRLSSSERENEEFELRENSSNRDDLSGLNSFQRRSPQDGEHGEYINFVEEVRSPQLLTHMNSFP